MNFELWQSQQKAQRDEERRRKNAAAEALQSYRGGLSEEDTKLTILREEERKKKLAAEQEIRDYRGGVSEEDTKLAMLREEERKKKFEAERRLRDYRSPRGLGSDTNNKPNSDIDKSSDPSNYPELVSGPSQDDPSNLITPGAVSAMAEKLNVVAPIETNDSNGYANTSIQNSRQEVLIQTPTEQSAMPNGTDPLQQINISETNKHIEDPMHAGKIAPQNLEFTVLNGSKPSMNGHQNFETQDAATEMKMSDETSVVSTHHLNAKFAFALISSDERPAFLSYLPSVEALVQTLLKESPYKLMDVSFGSPSVTNVMRDDTFFDKAGRSHVTKHIVTVSVPIVAPNELICQEVVDRVVSVVREAIHGSSFKKSVG